MMTLTPAYGRDYTSAKAVRADFAADRDFVIADVMSMWCGSPVNRQQLRDQGVPSVSIRYARNRKIVVVRV